MLMTKNLFRNNNKNMWSTIFSIVADVGADIPFYSPVVRADDTVVPPIAAIEQQPDLLLTFSYTTRPALVAPYWVFAHFSAFIRDTETGAIVSKIEFTQGPWKRKTAKTVIDEVVQQMR